MYKEFNKLSGNAKIWIYPAGRAMNENEKETVTDAAKEFCMQWKAHGKPLISSFEFLYDHFLILAVDESLNPVSGCSIDESVNFVRGLSEMLKIDFLNRDNVTFLDKSSGSIFSMKIKEAKEKASTGEMDGYHIFNNFIVNKSSLMISWIIPVKESWLKNRYSKKLSL